MQSDSLDHLASRPRRRARSGVAGLVAVLLLSVALVAPFYLVRRHQVMEPGSERVALPETHDMGQHASVLVQFDRAFRGGDLYPRWQPTFNKGYGLPWLNFYPPGFYFAAEPFMLLFRDWIAAMFATTVLFMAASAIAFYRLSRLFHSRAVSWLGALFFMIAPYRTLDVYWRGALPEVTGFFFVPLSLFFAYKAGTKGRPRDVAALALSHGLYMLCHFPVSYIFTAVLVAYAVAWAAMAGQGRIAVRIGSGVAGGFAVSATYWLVAMLEKKHIAEPYSEIYQYHQRYLTLAATDDLFLLMLNHCFSALLVAIVVSAAIVRATRWQRRLRIGGAASTVIHHRIHFWLAVVTLFMVTPFSAAFAKTIPHINSVSFPWRWMVLTTVFTALVFAAAAAAIARAAEQSSIERTSAYALVLLILLAISAVSSVEMVKHVFSPLNPHLYAAVSRLENGFRPSRAGDSELLPVVPQAMLEPAAAGTVDVVRWDPVHREVIADVREPAAVRLSTYRFRGWKARLDGKPVPIGADRDVAQLIPVPPGRHRLVVTFENLRTHLFAQGISCFSIVAAVLVIVADRRRVAKLKLEIEKGIRPRDPR